MALSLRVIIALVLMSSPEGWARRGSIDEGSDRSEVIQMLLELKKGSEERRPYVATYEGLVHAFPEIKTPKQRMIFLLYVEKVLPGIFEEAVAYDFDPVEMLKKQAELISKLTETEEMRAEFLKRQDQLLSIRIDSKNLTGGNMTYVSLEGLQEARQELIREMSRIQKSGGKPFSASLDTELINLIAACSRTHPQQLISAVIAMLPPGAGRRLNLAHPEEVIAFFQKSLPEDLGAHGFIPERVGLSSAHGSKSAFMRAFIQSVQNEARLARIAQLKIILMDQAGHISDDMNQNRERVAMLSRPDMDRFHRLGSLKSILAIFNNGLPQDQLRERLGIKREKIPRLVSDTVARASEHRSAYWGNVLVKRDAEKVDSFDIDPNYTRSIQDVFFHLLEAFSEPNQMLNKGSLRIDSEIAKAILSGRDPRSLMQLRVLLTLVNGTHADMDQALYNVAHFDADGLMQLTDPDFYRKQWNKIKFEVDFNQTQLLAKHFHCLPEEVADRIHALADQKLGTFAADVEHHLVKQSLEMKGDLHLVELPPDLAIFRGRFMKDCSSQFSFAYPNSSYERSFVISDDSGQLMGGISATRVTAEGKSALLIHTISGNRLTGADTEKILRGIFRARKDLGVDLILVPESSKLLGLLNFMPIRARVKSYSDSGRKVPLTFLDTPMRKIIDGFVLSKAYDGVGSHTHGVVVDFSEKDLPSIQVSAKAPVRGQQREPTRREWITFALQLHSIGKTEAVGEVLDAGLVDYRDFYNLLITLNNEKRLAHSDYLAEVQRAFQKLGVEWEEDLITKNRSWYADGELRCRDALAANRLEATVTALRDSFKKGTISAAAIELSYSPGSSQLFRHPKLESFFSERLQSGNPAYLREVQVLIRSGLPLHVLPQPALLTLVEKAENSSALFRKVVADTLGLGLDNFNFLMSRHHHPDEARKFLLEELSGTGGNYHPEAQFLLALGHGHLIQPQDLGESQGAALLKQGYLAFSRLPAALAVQNSELFVDLVPKLIRQGEPHYLVLQAIRPSCKGCDDQALEALSRKREGGSLLERMVRDFDYKDRLLLTDLVTHNRSSVIPVTAENIMNLLRRVSRDDGMFLRELKDFLEGLKKQHHPAILEVAKKVRRGEFYIPGFYKGTKWPDQSIENIRNLLKTFMPEERANEFLLRSLAQDLLRGPARLTARVSSTAKIFESIAKDLDADPEKIMEFRKSVTELDYDIAEQLDNAIIRSVKNDPKRLLPKAYMLFLVSEQQGSNMIHWEGLRDLYTMTDDPENVVALWREFFERPTGMFAKHVHDTGSPVTVGIPQIRAVIPELLKRIPTYSGRDWAIIDRALDAGIQIDFKSELLNMCMEDPGIFPAAKPLLMRWSNSLYFDRFIKVLSQPTRSKQEIDEVLDAFFAKRTGYQPVRPRFENPASYVLESLRLASINSTASLENRMVAWEVLPPRDVDPNVFLIHAASEFTPERTPDLSEQQEKEFIKLIQKADELAGPFLVRVLEQNRLDRSAYYSRVPDSFHFQRADQPWAHASPASIEAALTSGDSEARSHAQRLRATGGACAVGVLSQ